MAVKKGDVEMDLSRPDLDERILTLLRETSGQYLSENSLSDSLSVSPSTVWKRVGELRQQGYEIDGHPSLGYRLISSPDVLLPQEIRHGLKTISMGCQVFSYQRVRSTNDVALQRARNGAPEGTLVVAEEQTAGRGRLGRNWYSPPRAGLWASLILRPRVVPSRIFQLAICGALALAETVYTRTHLPVRVKWPNDVFIREKKLAGVLTEAQLDQNEVRFVILGMGVNVNQDLQDFPRVLRGKATSLQAELGRAIFRIPLLQDLLHQFEEIYHQFQNYGLAPFLDRWRQLSLVLGQRIEVQIGGKKFSGLAVNIEETGALVLEEDSGNQRSFLAGDVSLT